MCVPVGLFLAQTVHKPIVRHFGLQLLEHVIKDAEAASSTDEYYYLFLKKLCLLLVELGKQLAALWGNLPEVGQPQNFSTYLEAVFAFTQHPSRMLCSYTQPLWALFFRHDHMSKDPVLLSFIPRLIQGTHSTLVKAGFPTQNNSPSCEYSRHDFDSDDDFHQFLLKLRSEISETLRLAAVLQPSPAIAYAFDWLKSQLTKPIDTGGGKDYCSLFSPSFLEWDAMTVCLECVISKLSNPKSIPELSTGVLLLNEVLNYQTQIFSAVTFNQEGQTKSTRSRAVKNVRQHACSILVKMCKQYADLIFPVFDQLYSHIKTISSDAEGLSQMEKCILMEALILISNKSNNFMKQSEFLEEILRPVKEYYLSKEFTEAFWDPEKWMSFIGLDQAPVEPSSADTCGINRSRICYCTNMILAVLKRSKWPEEAQATEEGGFMIGKRDDCMPIYRNPATSHISLLLENLLAFMKTMNAVWQPQYLQKRHPAFSRTYELLENEKLAILGMPAPCVDITVNQNKLPSDRMQNFIVTTNDNNVEGAEDNMEAQEVIEDQLTRQLNREYMELLATALHMRRNEVVANVEEDRMDDVENPSAVQKEEVALSKLGCLCMLNKSVYPSIMMYVFSALTWTDYVACLRGCNLACSMMKQLVANGDATSDIAGSFFYQVLCGLQVHGQHEGSQSSLLNLALKLYELLRPAFPEIKNVLLQIPNIKEQDIQSFDEKMIFIKNPKQGVAEKKKKDSFKRLVSEVIGKSIGQQFKREAQYRNLPPIFRIRPPKEDIMKKQEDTGLWSLFNPSNGHNV
ncbi:hypothetical protein FSP39_009455 [Pinctada imbricata]|uniref:Exportin-5 C-terminal domain-containing protein n=1 Tax=Pinctada imbricata TaxID=66713 RepID=A0AA89C388_PINIB|nr:hypothetical protein FSP39_009455 [Pinctada imbricata]